MTDCCYELLSMNDSKACSLVGDQSLTAAGKGYGFSVSLDRAKKNLLPVSGIEAHSAFSHCRLEVEPSRPTFLCRDPPGL